MGEGGEPEQGRSTTRRKRSGLRQSKAEEAGREGEMR